MEMKKIAFATCNDKPDFNSHPYCADSKLAEKMNEKDNIQVDPVVWDNKNVNWSQYDAVIIRGPYDYLHKVESFKAWCHFIEMDKGIKLFNGCDITLWNMDKSRYLLDLQKKGISIIPTVFLEKNEGNDMEISLKDLMNEKHWSSAVVKPCISAESFHTEIIASSQVADQFQKDIFNLWIKESDMMVQKYIPELQSKGEWSLIYFDKKFSHCVLRHPIDGTDSCCMFDSAKNIVEYICFPPEKILKFADKVVACICEDLLFCRVDIVEHQSKQMLMEFEMLDTYLFLNHHPAAIDTMIGCILNRL